MARKVFLALRMAAVAPLFMLFTIFVASLIVVVALIRQDAPLIQRLIVIWSRAFLWTLGSTIDVAGRDKIDPNGQYIFVANHLSNADIPAMFLTAPVPIRYLAKKEVYKIPMVGMAMGRMGMVKVDRGSGSAVPGEVNAGVAEAKRRGHSHIIFPEGTRAVGGTPAQFKKGAFRIAIASRLTVVPVTIEGTWEIWRPGAKMFERGHIRTLIHDPIATSEMTLADMDTLRDQTRTAIIDGWEALRTGS